MKKTISLCLAVILVLGLCACGKESAPATQQQQQAPEFKVGYGRMDITPTEMGLPLGGYGQSEKRLHTKVLDPLYVTAVAITGTNGETIILMSMDIIDSTMHKTVRQRISSELDIPYDNVMFAATHTHSAPDQYYGTNGGFVLLCQNNAIKAAEMALEDQSPATISVGRTETENLNFVRHYLMKDGTYAGDNFGIWDSGIAAHAEENDPEMQIIKFTRPAEDKKDIVMVNWQGHPCMTGGVSALDMSADYIGSTRQQFEYQTKMHFIYFLGASGNQNVKSYIEGETRTFDYQEQGKFLTEYLMDALENNMTEVSVGKVGTYHHVQMCEINRDMHDRVDDAAAIQALYQATDRETANKLAQELGFSSVYHAGAVLANSGIQEDEEPMDLTVYAFGDASLAAAPYEMFAAHGVKIKEGTPYAMTFVSTCSNGSTCYLPTEKAYAFGCYESHTSRFTGDTGTKCADAFLSMLETLKAE